MKNIIYCLSSIISFATLFVLIIGIDYSKLSEASTSEICATGILSGFLATMFMYTSTRIDF